MAKELIVGTYNIKNKTADLLLRGKNVWENKTKSNVALISGSGCDVVGLQEVTPKAMKCINSTLIGNFKLVGDYRQKRGISKEACPILIDQNSCRLVDFKTYAVGPDINDIGSKFKGALFPRICTVAHIEKEDNSYAIFNTHIDNSPMVQEKSYNALANIIEEELVPWEDIILMGDFNFEISGPLLEFCQNYSFSDSLESLGKTYKPLNMALDHILYRDYGDIVPIKSHFIISNASDHSLMISRFKKRS